jgi:hypothetical protein
MKVIFSIAICLLYINSYSQKVYINREGVARLTKRMEACKLMEKRLAYSNYQISQLRIAIIENEIEFENKLNKLDSVIAIAENDFVELENRYKEALDLIPKRKRKLINTVNHLKH